MDNLANILPLHPEGHVTKSKEKPTFKLSEHLKAINRNSVVKLRINKTVTGKNYFYLETNVNNKRAREYLKFYYSNPVGKPKGRDKENLELAEKYQKNRNQKYLDEGQGINSNKLAKKIIFRDYYKYALLRTQEECNGRIDKAWNHTLLHLNKFLQKNPSYKNIPLKFVNTEYCRKFRNYLLSNLSPNSAHTYFSKFKATLNRAVQEGLIFTSPANDKTLNIKQVPTIREYLLLEEIQLLSKTHCISEQTKRAFLFACFTGLRISDLKKLTWGEIRKTELVYRQKKTNRPESLELHETALEILECQKRESGTCEANKKVFNLISNQNSREHIAKWVKLAGINKKIFWHSARHTFATLSLSSGNDIYTTSKLLGHQSVKVTEKYSNLINARKVEAIRNMPKIDL